MLDVTKLLCRTPHPALSPGGGEDKGEGVGRYAGTKRPVVVWNVTRRCNLHCRHCYAEARTAPRPEELTREEGRALVDELGRLRTPALIFSGGEPLLRPDLPELALRAADFGIFPALSTNGTLIDGPMARSLREAGVGYVGVSLDGIGSLHDRFRGLQGAWELALSGLRNCRDAGLQVGLRFTLSRHTLPHLSRVLDLMEAEGVQRGYVSHLVYVGRARRMAPFALRPRETRTAVEMIFDRAESLHSRGSPLELVTGNSDADGALLYLRAKEKRPENAGVVYDLLLRRGGNSAGVAIANVDDRGEVHPDQFWPHHSLGSVRERSFGEIWGDSNQPLLARLRSRNSHIHGRCSRCQFFDICGGGSRVRAEALTGDLWASDPACYLTDEELSAVSGQQSVADSRSLRAESLKEPEHALHHSIDSGSPDTLSPECASQSAGR